MNSGYLLDTCAWLDLNIAPERLSQPARDIMRQTDHFQLASISQLEVSRKAALGKLVLSMPLDDWMRTALPAKRIRVLPITVDISIESYRLPEPFHPDPADRLITATARIHHLTILTSDQKILDYPHVKSISSR